MFDAVSASIQHVLTKSNRPQLLVADQGALALVGDYISFSTLLSLGFADIVELRPQLQLSPIHARLAGATIVICPENVAMLEGLLADGLIKNVDVLFTQACDRKVLQRLARMDAKHTRVLSVCELNVNFALCPLRLFHCRLDPHMLTLDPLDWTPQDHKTVQTFSQSVLQFLNVLGVQAGYSIQDFPDNLTVLTPIQSKVSNAVSSLVLQQLGLTPATPSSSTPLTMASPIALVILDRAEDPITPLLSPWTYLGMVTEYLRPKNGIITLSTNEELTITDDAFFKAHCSDSYGDIASLLSQKNTVVDESVINNLDRLRERTESTQKHSKILHEITTILDRRKIFEVWESEMEILTSSALTTSSSLNAKLKALLPGLEEPDAQRIIKLYVYKAQMLGEPWTPELVAENLLGSPPGCISQGSIFEWTQSVRDTKPLMFSYAGDTMATLTRVLTSALLRKYNTHTPLTHSVAQAIVKGHMPKKMSTMFGSLKARMQTCVICILGRVYACEATTKAYVGGFNL